MSTPKGITDFSVNTDIEEATGTETQYWCSMLEDLKSLEADKRFQRVILNGYFKDFAINQTSLLAMDYIKKEGARAEVMERLISVSNLQDFFITISQLGASTEDAEVEG